MKRTEIIILAIFLLTTEVILGQAGNWEIYDEMQYPVARGQVVVANDVIYILGGYSQELQRTVKWIQKYNPILQDVWKQFGEMQLQRGGFVADLYQDGIYYCGGVMESLINSNSLEKWNYTQTGDIIHSDINFTRIYATGQIVSGDFYLIGGNPTNSTNYLPYIVSFDLQNNNVQVLEDNIYSNRSLPEHQMSCILSNNIYIFGGVIYGISQDIYKFDLTSHTLEKLAIPLLQPRAAGSAVAVPGENMIYIIGGFNEYNSSLNSVEIFKITDSGYEISQGPYLNYARAGCMTAKTSTDIFVFGGFDETGNVVPFVEKLGQATTGVGSNSNEIISDFSISQNYPNPFNSTTNINIKVQKESELSLDIYSVLGEHVKNITNGNHKTGNYSYQWNGKDESDNTLPSGIYFYKITSDTFSKSKKMVLLK